MTLRASLPVAPGALLAALLAFGTPSPAEAADRQARALSTQLPIVLIDSPRQIRDEPKVRARMRVINRRGRRPNRISLRPNAYSGLIAVETRGATSLVLPKKQYTVETRTRAGKNRNVGLLGMPKDNDWVLSAPFGDRSLMRNVLAYCFSQTLGRYASRTRFVELVLNGRYQGVYVLMEKLKLDKRRVDTGDGDDERAYLVERASDEKLKPGDDVFRLPVSGLPVAYTDPEHSDMPPAQAEGIRNELAHFESLLYSDAFRDPDQGYRAELDVAAAVDYVLVNELFKNADAFLHSLYMHRGAGTGLRLGPVWDLDVSSGNVPFGEADASPHGWIGSDRSWADRLYADPAFAAELAIRWREIRAGDLIPQLLRAVDSNAALLRRAQPRDYRRWGHEVDYASEVAQLRAWLNERVAWIDANIAGLAPPP